MQLVIITLIFHENPMMHEIMASLNAVEIPFHFGGFL